MAMEMVQATGRGGLPGRAVRARRADGGAQAAEAAVPMGEINTTPLVDVMLVLLVMFIITVPLSTHAVKLDLPSGTPPAEWVDPVVNELTIDGAGATRWNGAPVSAAERRALLAASATILPHPELHLRPSADAPYDAVDAVLTDAKRADVRRLGFVGNEGYRDAF